MLEICPVSLKEANAFVAENHRHHKPVTGHKFSIACADGEKIVGVAIVGRPVSRHLDDGWTLEVNRLCTDGTRNACSMLYAAAWRAARAMGYRKLESFLYVFDICMHLLMALLAVAAALVIAAAIGIIAAMLIALLWERVNRIFDRLTGPEEKKRREDRRARKELARQRHKAEKRE